MLVTGRLLPVCLMLGVAAASIDPFMSRFSLRGSSKGGTASEGSLNSGESDLFVFPSMGMGRVHSSSHGPPPAPEPTQKARVKNSSLVLPISGASNGVEVTYHGEKTDSGSNANKSIKPPPPPPPPFMPTPLPRTNRSRGKSRPKDRKKLLEQLKRKPKSFAGTTVTAATWNPDSIDHTVNPNKSRKMPIRTTPMPREPTARTTVRPQPAPFTSTVVTRLRTSPMPKRTTSNSAPPSVHTMTTTRPRVRHTHKVLKKRKKTPKSFPKVQTEFKTALESSVDHRAWKQLKEDYMQQSMKDKMDKLMHTVLNKSQTLTLGSAFNVPSKAQSESNDLLSPEKVKEEQLRMLEEIFPNFPSANSFKLGNTAPKASGGESSSGYKDNLLQQLREEAAPTQAPQPPPTTRKPPPPAASFNEFENFPANPHTTRRPNHLAQTTSKAVTLSNILANREEELLRQRHLLSGTTTQAPRLPRDYSISQTLNSKDSIAVHTSSAIGHPSDPGHGMPKSYQTLTIVHPKQKDYPQHQPTTTTRPRRKPTPTYLPPQITLHTTATPNKSELPPHLKNRDTVLLNLPHLKPTDIPHGYELIPLDKLTSEYEVVPWKEARKVLNVTVSSLGEPKHLKEGHQVAAEAPADHYGQPQSGYSASSTVKPYDLEGEYHQLPSEYHNPAPPAYPKEPQSGYGVPTAEPIHHHVNSVVHHDPPKAPHQYSTTAAPVHHREPMSGYGAPTPKPYQHHQKTTPKAKDLYSIFGGSPTPHPAPYHPHTTVKQLPREPQSGYANYSPKPSYEHHQPPAVKTSSLPRVHKPTHSPYQHHNAEKVHIVTPQASPTQGYGVPQSGYAGKPHRQHEIRSTQKPHNDYSYNSLAGSETTGDWYQPPPISPDLPPLFYDDHLKGNAGSKLSTSAEVNKPIPPVVKSLGGAPHYKAMHFGADYGPRLVPLDANYGHGPSTPVPHIKKLETGLSFTTTKSPYHPEVKSIGGTYPYGAHKPHYHSTPKPAYHPTPQPHYNSSPKPHYNSSPKPHYNSSPKPHYHSTPKPYQPTPKPYQPTPKPHYLPPRVEAVKSKVEYHHSKPKPAYKEEKHKEEWPAPSKNDYLPPQKALDHPKLAHKPSKSYLPPHSPEKIYTASPRPYHLPKSYQDVKEHSYDHYGPTTPPAPTPTTSVLPYRHWSTPGGAVHHPVGPTKHAFVNIHKYEEESYKEPKHLYETPEEINHISHASPKPSYHSTPKPSYHSSPKPSYHGSPKPSYEPTPKPGYHGSPKPSYEPTPKPGYHGSPKPIFDSTPSSYGHEPIFKSTPRPSYHSTPKPSYHSTPKSSYHSTPKPDYNQPSRKPDYKHVSSMPHLYSTPKPLHQGYAQSTPYQASGPIHYSTIKPKDGRMAHVKQLSMPTPGPHGYSPSPYGYSTPNPYAHGHVRGIPLYTPTTPRPANPHPTYGGYPASPYTPGYHGSTYAPDTQKSYVKSLPGLHGGNPHYNPQFPHPKRSFGQQGQYYGRNGPGDIPIHVNHFPSPTPHQMDGSKKMMDFYTSPKPVYRPSGGIVKGMPQVQRNPQHNYDGFNSYLSQYPKALGLTQESAQPDSRLDQLHKYLSSIDEGNPQTKPDAEVIKELLNSMADENNNSKEINISFPEAENREGKIDIAALSRSSAQPKPFTTPSTTVTTTTTTTTATTTTSTNTPIPSSGVWFMGDDGTKKKFIPGQVMIKNDDGEITFREGGLMIKNERAQQKESPPEQQRIKHIRPAQPEIQSLHQQVLFPEKEPIPFLEVARTPAITEEQPVTTRRFPGHLSQPTAAPLFNCGQNSPPGIVSLFEQIMNVAASQSEEEVYDNPYSASNKQKPAMIILPTDANNPSTLRISAYDKERGNNILITNNTEETLNQLTLTLRGLTTTIRSLNATIMDTNEKMKKHAAMAAIAAVPRMEKPPSVEDSQAVQMIQFLQGEISKLTQTVENMRDQQRQHALEEVMPVSREEIRDILENVVKEATKVAKLKSDLTRRPNSGNRQKFRPKSQNKLNLVVAGNGVQSERNEHTSWYSVTPSPDHLKEQLAKLQDQKERQHETELRQQAKQQQQLQQLNNDNQATTAQKKVKLQQLKLNPQSASSGIGLFEMMGNAANKNHGNQQIFNIPVSASLGGPVGASLQVVDPNETAPQQSSFVRNPFTGQSSFVVGSSVLTPVPNVFQQQHQPSTAVPNQPNQFTGGSVSNNHGFSFSTTMKPLAHAFNPSNAPSNDLHSPPQSATIGGSADNIKHFHPSKSLNGGIGIFHPTAAGLIFPPRGRWSPTLAPALGGSPTPKRSIAQYSSSMPVRFPESNQRVDNSYDDEFDVAQSTNVGHHPDYYVQQQLQQLQQQQQQQQLQQQQQPHFSTSYYNSANTGSGVGPSSSPLLSGQPKAGVNIMADLAHYTDRKNLLRGADASTLGNGYIQPGNKQASGSMEVIMYPSGQLLKSDSDGSPPSSTIGSKLEAALIGQYYRSQIPHYVLAKNRRVVGIEADTETFDPYYESDETFENDYSEYEDSSAESSGIIPQLIQMGKDDLTLMGNVIKLALT